MRLTVLTTSKSSGIGSGLTYETNNADIREGSHVLVPLRRQLVEGLVIEIQKKKMQEEFDVKEVKTLLHDTPLLTEAQLKTLRWMAEEYCCTLRQALSVWLPSPPWKNLLPQTESFFRLVKANIEVRGKKQQAVIEALKNGDSLSSTKLKDETGVSPATLHALMEKGIIEKVEKKEEFVIRKKEECFPGSVLTTQQEVAFTKISSSSKPALLFGVTGSGKTEVYARLIADAINNGKQAILLVPEILLTENSIHRFQTLLPAEQISVLHSRLPASKRRNEWRRIHRGEVDLVIGSRSALFAPLKHLGLVVVDEEHEWTYKNEQTPRYHVRETAEELCKNAGARLLFGTATPSMECWVKAKDGTYTLARLDTRYKEMSFPKVTVVDLGSISFGKESQYPLSAFLLEKIGDTLKKGKQSILFLNRRGAHSALLCLDCRRRVVSPETNLPFTVHKDSQGRPYLLDHNSGLRSEAPSLCPSCKSPRLLAIGAGTQKIEEILRKHFPEARIRRADSDTLTHPEHLRDLLDVMREGKADILLGTQVVTKGLDLPNVTLAAVLIADIGLSLPHFRAGERIFQLVSQLTGRSGRHEAGEVVIQTFRPDAPEIKLASLHQTETFLNQELALRLHTGYPPASKMIRILPREMGSKKAQLLHAQIALEAEKRHFAITVNAAEMLFGGGKKWHVLLRGKNPREVLPFIDLSDCVIDVDPMECI